MTDLTAWLRPLGFLPPTVTGRFPLYLADGTTVTVEAEPQTAARHARQIRRHLRRGHQIHYLERHPSTVRCSCHQEWPVTTWDAS